MWLIIAAAVMAAVTAGTVYLTIAVGRFGIVKKIAGDKKPYRALVSFAMIAAVFSVIALAMSFVNAVVVFLHAVLFFLLFGLIVRIVKRAAGREPKACLQGWLALSVMAVYLVIGNYLCVNVWQKDYALTTDKEFGTLRIALIADSHIGSTFDGEGFAEHLRTIEAQAPDILLIAGDFVDDWSNRADMLRACEALGQAKIKYGVYYTYGNHDAGFFNERDFSADELRQALEDNGVHILEDSYSLVDDRFYVAGRRDSSFGERMDMDELLDGAEKDKYVIVIDHQPSDYENEAGRADLVVSGHTHGGQIIPITYVGELFGIVDNTYGYENRNGTDFIVTSGISDWDIQFKTGTRSEYVIIDIAAAGY